MCGRDECRKVGRGNPARTVSRAGVEDALRRWYNLRLSRHLGFGGDVPPAPSAGASPIALWCCTVGCVLLEPRAVVSRPSWWSSTARLRRYAGARLPPWSIEIMHRTLGLDSGWVRIGEVWAAMDAEAIAVGIEHAALELLARRGMALRREVDLADQRREVWEEAADRLGRLPEVDQALDYLGRRFWEIAQADPSFLRAD